MVMPGLGLLENCCPSQIEALVLMKMKQAVEKYLGHTAKKKKNAVILLNSMSQSNGR